MLLVVILTLCFTGCLARVDLLFMVSSSAEVGKTNFRQAMQFVTDIVENLNVDTGHARVGVTTYGHLPTIHVHLADSVENKPSLLQTIGDIDYVTTDVDTASALRVAREVLFQTRNGGRDDVPNVIVLVSDGLTREHARMTFKEAARARDDEITVIIVGVAFGVKAWQLNKIASRPRADYKVALSSYDDLQPNVNRVYEAICKGRSA